MISMSALASLIREKNASDAPPCIDAVKAKQILLNGRAHSFSIIGFFSDLIYLYSFASALFCTSLNSIISVCSQPGEGAKTIRLIFPLIRFCLFLEVVLKCLIC